MSILCGAFNLAAVRINFKNIRRTNKLNIALLRMCSTKAVRIANECWDTGAVRIATSITKYIVKNMVAIIPESFARVEPPLIYDSSWIQFISPSIYGHT